MEERCDFGLHVVAVEVDEGTLVANLVAIVGSGKDGDELVVVLLQVPLIFDLMRADQKVKAVLGQKPLCNVRSKGSSSPAL